WAVARDDALQAVGNPVERGRPVGAPQRAALLPYHRMQQTALVADRLAERRALGAERAEIRRMHGVARDRHAPAALRPREHAAADAAIRTRRAHGLELLGVHIHQ